ncbi:CRISPR-associated protein Csx14 [Pelotomaculum terephthalicicum JT]|uniref:CRISPR-associated protein Csx14 n=1 Tax=Pelotomaculum terephthalicicum TaxID=206393 RepID=UPI001F040D38|nr:CRISPR-associated protein Csx14 [Pelotomaculum terephthalicicum]MCG9968437.1 CRISPR-associated protein Csx14 [Pelotomaculum terephthalicicum JT]
MLKETPSFHIKTVLTHYVEMICKFTDLMFIWMVNCMNAFGEQEILIATVGTEPQVITLVLDSLLLKGCNIDEVVLFYTQSPLVMGGIEKIQREIESEFYPKIILRSVLITGEKTALDDFRTANDVNSMLKIIYKVIKDYKQKGAKIHLSVSGGRKVMGIMAMVVAQILFRAEDRLWYLITEGWKPGNSQDMHISNLNSHLLIEVPVVRWEESSLLLGMEEFASPLDLIRWQEKLIDDKRMRRRREFVEHWLSKAERQVAQLACQGWDNAMIAGYLHKQERTVVNQMTSIYGKMHEWLEFPDCRVERSVLIAELAPYFALRTDDIG